MLNFDFNKFSENFFSRIKDNWKRRRKRKNEKIDRSFNRDTEHHHQILGSGKFRRLRYITWTSIDIWNRLGSRCKTCTGDHRITLRHLKEEHGAENRDLQTITLKRYLGQKHCYQKTNREREKKIALLLKNPSLK